MSSNLTGPKVGAYLIPLVPEYQGGRWTRRAPSSPQHVVSVYAGARRMSSLVAETPGPVAPAGFLISVPPGEAIDNSC